MKTGKMLILCVCVKSHTYEYRTNDDFEIRNCPKCGGQVSSVLTLKPEQLISKK